MAAYKSYAALRNNEDIEGVGHSRVKFEGKFTFGLWNGSIVLILHKCRYKPMKISFQRLCVFEIRAKICSGDVLAMCPPYLKKLTAFVFFEAYRLKHCQSRTNCINK